MFNFRPRKYDRIPDAKIRVSGGRSSFLMNNAIPIKILLTRALAILPGHGNTAALALTFLLFLQLFPMADVRTAHAALARKDAVQASDLYNPHPDAGDILLPMPGGLKMAFRLAAVPARGILWDMPLRPGRDDIANPGCFATAIQLALLPLASAGLINDEVHVSAITGSTGAGKKLSETSHFSYRDNNISIYKLFTHQHLGEIRKNIAVYLGKEPVVNFVPVRGDFPRGIFASVYTRADAGVSEEEYVGIFEEYYRDSPFVFHSAKGISMKEAVNTNKGLLHVELHDGYVHVSSAIDNLVKGASGQAVQNMNLMFGLEETAGLKLKASAF